MSVVESEKEIKNYRYCLGGGGKENHNSRQVGDVSNRNTSAEGMYSPNVPTSSYTITREFSTSAFLPSLLG